MATAKPKHLIVKGTKVIARADTAAEAVAYAKKHGAEAVSPAKKPAKKAKNPGKSSVRRAADFLSGDPSAVRSDIKRLGLAEAAKYNARLAKNDSNPAFHGITIADMKTAMKEYAPAKNPTVRKPAIRRVKVK